MKHDLVEKLLKNSGETVLFLPEVREVVEVLRILIYYYRGSTLEVEMTVVVFFFHFTFFFCSRHNLSFLFRRSS